MISRWNVSYVNSNCFSDTVTIGMHASRDVCSLDRTSTIALETSVKLLERYAFHWFIVVDNKHFIVATLGIVLSVMGIGCCIISTFREKKERRSYSRRMWKLDEGERSINWSRGWPRRNDCLIDRSISNHRWGYIYYVSGYTWWIVDSRSSHRLFLDFSFYSSQWMNWLLSLTRGKFSLFHGLWFMFKLD